MTEYKIRDYRDRFDNERWHFFTVCCQESDLFIGVDRESYTPSMETFVLESLRSLRNTMERYIARDAQYARSITPYQPAHNAPEILRHMADVAAKAGIGPMGAIAGAVAEEIGSSLRKKFNVQELIVENGGDIYTELINGIDVPVFAGDSPLSEIVGISIGEGKYHLGICTSSGTVGHSFSFGKADAVMIVCEDAALADSYATAFANRIQTKADVASTIELIKEIPEITGAICIKHDQVGICGQYALKIWK